MDKDLYEQLTGTTVSNETKVTATIRRTKAILEALLGYSLDVEKVNEYDEAGISPVDCPCDADLEALLPADEVVGSYRLYKFDRRTKIISFDPASDVYAIKLVRNGVTYRTFEAGEFNLIYKHGFTKYAELCDNYCTCTTEYCGCSQLAVDADYLWDDYENSLPDDLLDLWAEMVTYYSNPKFNIKRETLATHSYELASTKTPEEEARNLLILQKYAGPNGTINRPRT